MTGIAVGRQWGIITANEGRHILDLNPSSAASADILWAPVNMQNSEWMIDTESIQDQPVGNKPDDEQPSLEQKSSRIKRIENSYALLFRDALGRAIQRPVEQRSKSIAQIFEPVVRSLAAATGAADKHVESCLAGLAKRSTKWVSTDHDEAAEFQRVVRGLHLNACRDKAAKYADEEIKLALPEPPKETEDED